jgi:glycosyltransferase involved in cell wall biosynthesis
MKNTGISQDVPFFSVIICCYNSGDLLRETLDSIVAQSFENWEIVAVNDGSTDNTEYILKEYQAKGIAITYFRQANQGFAAARNKAVELARAEWIVILDHDDICLENRLEVQASNIQANPEARLFFSDATYFGSDGELKRHFDRFSPADSDLSKNAAMNSLLSNGCFVASVSATFSKSAAELIGGFDTSYKYVVDYDFFIRMGSLFDFFCCDEALSKWRVHSGQATQQMSKLAVGESNKVFLRYFFADGVTTLTKFYMCVLYLRRNVKGILNRLQLMKTQAE